jgi:hypothetical protein
MPIETTPLRNPNNENFTREEKSLVNRFKDTKLFDPYGTEVVMSKTARTALLIIMHEHSDVKADVAFRNFKKDEERPPMQDHVLQFTDFENGKYVLSLSDKKPDMNSEKGRFINIEILTERMGLKSKNVTEDMAYTFAVTREIAHYFKFRNKTAHWHEDNFKRDLKDLEEEDKKLKEKSKEEKDLLLTKFSRTRPEEIETDEYAAKWMGYHMYLFNPEVNPYLGQWSGEPEQHPLQAGIVYQNPS